MAVVAVIVIEVGPVAVGVEAQVIGSGEGGVVSPSSKVPTKVLILLAARVSVLPTEPVLIKLLSLVVSYFIKLSTVPPDNENVTLLEDGF